MKAAACLWISTLFLLSLSVRPTAAQQSAPLVVELDARDASAGTERWINHGMLGAFERVGQPKVVEIGGVKAVAFDGKQDAYRSPVAPPEIVGRHPRTIEAWAYNPSLDSDEETLVSLGKRGGPSGTLLAFGWGRNPVYGAVAHWASDLGWNGVPKPKRWHYLVYTYDGKTARIYDNGLEKSARDLALNTTAGFPIVLAAETSGNGKIQFTNEYTGSQQAGSLLLAAVRIRMGALTAEQIGQTFDAEATRFGAERAIAGSLMRKGTRQITVGDLTLTLLNATQTAVSLSPTGSTFDFLPADRLTARLDDGFYHLGDITLRTQEGGEQWRSFSTATVREALSPLDTPTTIVATDLKPTLGADCPLSVRREWTQQDGHLVLRFHLTNPGTKPVRIGAFGIPMVFNNVLTGRSLDEAHEKCSFSDPYIGGENGYLQVTRLNGKGPALLVLPERGTSFEAYRPLYDDPTPREVTFEGFYEWMVHTTAYAENEWKQAQPWNTPTDKTLQPGESATYGFEFVLSPSIAEIEPTLIAQKRPVAIGIPGYVLPSDQTGKLFLHTAQPLKSLRSEPEDAVEIKPDGDPTAHGWLRFTVHGRKIGRTRLVATYTDGSTQTIHYDITQPEATAVEKLGAFHAAKQWYDDPNDPFHRTDSFMQFDRDTDKIVLQHSHTWFVGLSDEIGAGPSVAMAMKNLGQPDASQIALLETYVNHTLWGRLQYPDYGVRASLFYYDPKEFPHYYTVRGGWDNARTQTTWRAYNYPHVAAVYWALYRLARNHTGLVKQKTWQWYLRQAYGTAMALQTKSGPKSDHYGLAQFGLMVGSVFPEILNDLKREGWTKEADAMGAFMRERADHWRSLKYPYGSEMPWDSTGQEEVYTWSRYFGYDDKAQVTLNAILGYMPTVPNWAYNGAARRYFDAPVNGTRWPDIVRMTNHYGSALNSIPVLDAFRQHPDDLRLLRIGYAGMSQVAANIDARGFGSYGFDADPRILQFDPYTADYGIAFYGYAHNTGAYVTNDPEFGWLGFGCDLLQARDSITFMPKDGFRSRVFLAPLHLWLTLDSGTFESVHFNPTTRQVDLQLSPMAPGTTVAALRIETTGNAHTRYLPDNAPQTVRDAYPFVLRTTPTTVLLRPTP
ncbi:MAG: hypothetical protein JWL77_5795 [Chthonomonadaceae bacterium]|nr:hypothetical protein [Chthonomonadaceae bacterium]